MFSWFSGSEGVSGQEKMRAEFGQMLDAARHIFDTAADAFLSGTDIDQLRPDLFATDRQINDAERRIRREIVVHATVHGTVSFPSCLVLMSIVKDAERLGDYAKNILDLADLSKNRPTGEYRDDLAQLKDQISRLMASCREAFDQRNEEVAKELISEAQRLEDHCDAQISKILKDDEPTEMGPTYALAYRYFKRITSHSFNVLTSIVQPIDRLDFSDQRPDSDQ